MYCAIPSVEIGIAPPALKNGAQTQRINNVAFHDIVYEPQKNCFNPSLIIVLNDYSPKYTVTKKLINDIA